MAAAKSGIRLGRTRRSDRRGLDGHRGVIHRGLLRITRVLALIAAPHLLFAAPLPPAGADGTPLPSNSPAIGLADPAALRATVFGTPPEDMAPMPARVPVQEMDMAMPWALPVPEVLWFDRRLRVWFSAQDKPAPLVIVISGTGSDGDTKNMSILRGALYGAGYHVLTMPSPTFPRFIVSTSSTGVAGDLLQDGRDLYAAMQRIIAHLPKHAPITDVDVLGCSLGGANAAIVKSIDAREGKLRIHRAIMINPPVSLFASIKRLDDLFDQSLGPGDAGLENLYRRLFTRLANLYRASEKVQINDTDLLVAAASVLRTDQDFAAAVALTFRLKLVDVFLAGDLFARTGVVIDPEHPPGVEDSLEEIGRQLRSKTFVEYFNRVFAPYYMAHRAGATPQSLQAENHLDIIATTLRDDPDYYAQTNSDDLILSESELVWLRTILGTRVAVYDHGGHLGNLGERRHIADMLEMLAGRWPGQAAEQGP
jgi:hypothetical protein